MTQAEPSPAERWRRLESLFYQAIDLESEERSRFVELSCAGDDELERELTRLVRGHDDAQGTFLEPGSASEEAPLAPSIPASMPREIGHYHLKRVIASGGMGTVYEAVQEHPRRTVAVKVMKQGLASRSMLRRFEFESQILARLRHPGIAQVYEAGVHDDGSGGVPYFAMEYIPNARPITRDATERGLGLRERLELFTGVCSAVHHGHQKGIIHRDLKPDNVLVDSNHQVKIIDFGVARATDSDMAVTTLQTDIGVLVGSVAYMSPEQVEADPHDLDIRSDVYSLGVLLFELVTGRLPYDVKGVPVYEATRVIKQEMPGRITAFDRGLRGDLETIIRHALEKDRERRYQSANEMRRDVERYLNCEPISARPPSVVYQLRVFARHHRALAVSALVVLLVLAAASVVSTAFAVAATRAGRAEAEAAARSEQVTRFLKTILTSAIPEHARGRVVTVREVLDEAARRVETELAGQPAVEAAARTAIGESYQSLGLLDEAGHHLTRALERERAIHAREERGRHLHVAQAMLALADVLLAQDRIEPADRLIDEAWTMLRRTRGDDDPETAAAVAYAAASLMQQGRHDEAEVLIERALTVMRTTLGEEDVRTLDLYNTWALAVNGQARYAEAEPYFRELLERMRRVRGEDHPSMSRAYNNLAWSLQNQGRYAEAESFYVKALAVDLRVHGEAHPHTGLVRANLGQALMSQGKVDEAETQFRAALAVVREALGEDHAWTAGALSGIAWVLSSREEYEEAAEYSRRSLAAHRALGPGHPRIAWALQSLARDLAGLGRLDEAEPLLREALETALAHSAARHDRTGLAYNNLAFNLSQQGRHAEAEPLFERGLEIRDDVLGRDHPHTLISIHNLGRARLEQGKLEEAEPLLREAVASAAAALPEGHWHTGVFRLTLGRCLRRRGSDEEAERHLQAAHNTLRTALGEDHDRTRQAADELDALYETWAPPGPAAARGGGGGGGQGDDGP